MRQVLDALLGAVGAADVHTGVGVGHGRRAGCGSLGHRFFFQTISIKALAWGWCRVPTKLTDPKADDCSTFNMRLRKPKGRTRESRTENKKINPEKGSDTFTVFRGRARPFANANLD